jgi:hypothetical protein
LNFYYEALAKQEQSKRYMRGNFTIYYSIYQHHLARHKAAERLRLIYITSVPALYIFLSFVLPLLSHTLSLAHTTTHDNLKNKKEEVYPDIFSLRHHQEPAPAPASFYLNNITDRNTTYI